MVQQGKDSLTLVAVGDIRLARKDPTLSFAKVAHIIKSADIAFFNCETTYAERGNSTLHELDLPHDPKQMVAFTGAGFNVCTLANNLTLLKGVDAAVETRERLEAMGIAVCGFGRNMSEARQPAIVEKKGVKIAFLGYLSVGPIIMAEEDKPGVAMVRAHTVYEPYRYHVADPHRLVTWPYKEDLDYMIEDIKKAREQADIVIVTDHWGKHGTPVVIPDYEWEIGHAAIDGGADLVLGTHPHILKAIEVYKGGVIIHSLANFAMEDFLSLREGERRTFMIPKSHWHLDKILEGPTSPDNTKTIVVKCIISGKKIERVSYIPALLDEGGDSPEPLPRSDPRSQGVFRYVEDITRATGLDTRFAWEGEEVVIGG